MKGTLEKMIDGWKVTVVFEDGDHAVFQFATRSAAYYWARCARVELIEVRS